MPRCQLIAVVAAPQRHDPLVRVADDRQATRGKKEARHCRASCSCRKAATNVAQGVTVNSTVAAAFGFAGSLLDTQTLPE